MGKYQDMVKGNYNKLRNDDGVMWASVALVDELLEEMAEHHKDRYWQMMRDTHELMYGKHFDQTYAERQVSQMSHKGVDGKMHKGEHWSIEDVVGVLGRYRGQYNPEYNEWDAYVALNSQWHDTINVALRHLGTTEAAEAYVIDEAIAFWLADSDWPTPDKVWVYFRKR